MRPGRDVRCTPDARQNRRTINTCLIGEKAKKTFLPWGSAQPLEKAHFGQGNPRKTKLFPWKNLVQSWRGLAWLCWIWGEFGRCAVAERGDCAESACRTGREQLGFVRDLFTQAGDSPPSRVREANRGGP